MGLIKGILELVVVLGWISFLDIEILGCSMGFKPRVFALEFITVLEGLSWTIVWWEILVKGKEVEIASAVFELLETNSIERIDLPLSRERRAQVFRQRVAVLDF